jgi:hypothetical protein
MVGQSAPIVEMEVIWFGRRQANQFALESQELSPFAIAPLLEPVRVDQSRAEVIWMGDDLL